VPQGEPPVAVRRCRFTGGKIAVQVSGRRPCRGVIIAGNDFSAPALGVLAVGSLNRVHVLGNTFREAEASAVQFEDVGPDTADVLVANNTFFAGRGALRLWDSGVQGKGVEVRGNLVLESPGPDMFVWDNQGPRRAQGVPGDGGLLRKQWTFSHNWREVTPPPPGTRPDILRAWVPIEPPDRRLPAKAGVVRDAGSPDFLRFGPQSPLASGGAGTADSSLPLYVGSAPPFGSKAWDWDRTWRARDQKKKGG